MAAKKVIPVVLSIVISVVLIGYLSTRIELDDLKQIFANIHYPALFAFMAISLLTSILRAVRYKWLLLPAQIGFGSILLVTFIRNLFVDLLPARLGSLSYVYILNKRLKYAFEEAASTFVVAFVLDFLTLSPFLAISILVVGLGATSVSSVSLLLIALFFFLLIYIVMWKIIPLSQLMLTVYQSLLRFLSLNRKKWAVISVDKIKLTIDGLEQIKERKILRPLFLLSLVLRLGKYGSLYFLLLSLLHSRGFSFQNLSFWKTILGITGGELTGALPIKGLAGFGTWESGWALAFRLMNFDSKISILSGIGVHLITNLFEYTLGILSILILAFPFVLKKKCFNNTSDKYNE
ncbi:lysylphosphatidylglycerol synthase domain-containing protein [Acidobacteriota bacterium]